MTDHDPRADLPVPNRRQPYSGPAHYAPPLAPDTGPVFEPPRPRRGRGDRGVRSDLGLVAFLLVAGLVGFAAWNLAGNLADRVLKPGPTTPGIAVIASASPGPSASVSSGRSPDPSPSAGLASGSPLPSESAAPEPTPTPTPRPERKPVSVRIERRPEAVFASEMEDTWCAAAAVQIALNVIGPRADVDTSRARQVQVLRILRDNTTRTDSRNGGAGPLGMVKTLEQLGDASYRLGIYDSRAEALQAAAKAIERTGNPAILLAWRGAHAWVMTGFKADADPTIFPHARVTGAYIIDPWYPRVSSIWGPSDGPGVFQDAAEMKRNYLPWKRPEGHYPGRDGNFLVILPRG